MKDTAKTKAQLIHELMEMRGKIASLECSESVHKRTVEELKASVRRWEAIFDAFQDAVCYLNPDGRILQCNKAMIHLLGKPREDILGLTCCELIHGTPQSIEEGPFERMKVTLHRETTILPFRDQWFHMIAHPLKDESGALVGAVHMISDVTKWKQSEEIALRERQTFYDVLERMPVYVALLTQDYHVSFANRYFRERFGESEGRHCYEYLFNRSEPCETCETYKILKTETPHRWEWLGPDGRNYNIFDFPFTDWDGSPLIMEVGIDITEAKQAEAAIRAERQRLYDVLETLPAMICLLTPDYHVAFANQSFRNKFGEAAGRHCYEYCYGQREPCTFCETYDVLKTGQPYHWEVTTQDGSIIDVHDFPFKDADGSPMILEMDIDITGHKQAVRALEDSERLFRTLTENMPDVVARFDRELRHVYINPAIERLTGRPAQEFIGKTNAELGMPEENIRKWDQYLYQVLQTQKATELEFDYPSQDGVLHFKTILIPEFGPDDAVETILSLTRDMTDTKRIEQTLKSVGGYTRNLIETSIDPLATIGMDGKITDVNDAMEKATGCPRSELIESDFSIYFTDPESARQGYQQAFLGGEVHDYPLEIRSRDGRIIPVSYNARVYRDEKGEVAGLFAAARDISQIRKAERSLSRQSESLREFSKRLANAEETERRRLAVALHDMVGQNLNALGINLGIVQGAISTMDNGSLALRLEDAQTLLQETIEGIRDIIADLRPSVLDDFGLSAAIRWYNEVFAKRTGTSLTLAGGTDLPRLSSHVEICLFRIYQEALTNVAKHAHATKADVSLEESGKNIRMIIRDNGSGFDSTKEANPAGQQKGWGLIMMAERAREVEGHFSIESSPDKGTRIVIEVER